MLMNEVLFFWVGIILVAINGAILILFLIWEFANWLSTTRWYKKHFTIYGG